MAISDFDLVLFGGTGDLAMRKLLPALYARDRARDLVPSARIVCIGRDNKTNEEFLQIVEQNSKPHISSATMDAEVWQRFCGRIQYVSLNAKEPATYQNLVAALRNDPAISHVFYLATPPTLFSMICDNLSQAGLATPNARVVLEKPLWRREWISDVQITIAEELGVGGRFDYYDTSGALRDMLQNHLLQLLCIVAMEPPVSNSADSVRDEKLKVLRSLKRFTPATLAMNVVRGQYRAGHVNGVAVPGYRKEEDANPDSRTETFVAVKAEIDTWRWAGVPFYLRTGKRMADSLAEIVVRFKSVPHSIFAQNNATPNCLVIRLQPDEGLHMNLMAKTPGDGMRLKPVELELDFREKFKTPRMEAYERLLLDVLRGQLTLFMRSDELEAAWEWVEPILEYWEQQETDPIPYSAGTWGPAAASALIGRDGLQWREEALPEL